MNVATSPSATRHPSLTGRPKRLFIDGKWVEAASGKTFDTHNPSTGEVLAAVQAMDPAVPFGGCKMSGYGRESGQQHVEEYFNAKVVWIKAG